MLEKDFNITLGEVKQRVKEGLVTWRDYYALNDRFAQVKYNHAITVHKAQGSTYKQAIVNVKNINFNKNESERQRLLYTAVTRASDLLIIF